WAVVKGPLGGRSQRRRAEDNTNVTNRIEPEGRDAMTSHVAAIALRVKDMDRSKRFYMEGLGWKVQDDYKISVFFVPHGGSIVGFYRRDGLPHSEGESAGGRRRRRRRPT